MRASILTTAAAFALVFGSAARAQQAEGERLFKQRCAACHLVEPGKSRPMGPNLHAVVGRDRAAGSAEFKTYSPAFRKLQGNWTEAELDKFLAAPSRYAPGTRMVIAVPDAAQRKSIIAYLASLKK